MNNEEKVDTATLNDEAEADTIVVLPTTPTNVPATDQVPVKPMIDIYYEMLLNEISTIVGQGEVTSLNVLAITISLMQVSEGFDELTGSQKKDLLLRALRKVVEEGSTDNSLLDLLPSFIDMAVNLDKGEVTIKLTTKDMIGCCSGILKTKRK